MSPRAPAPSWHDLRVSTGLTLRAFAAEAGINPGDLSRIERGVLLVRPDQARRILGVVDAYRARALAASLRDAERSAG